MLKEISAADKAAYAARFDGAARVYYEAFFGVLSPQYADLYADEKETAILRVFGTRYLAGHGSEEAAAYLAFCGAAEVFTDEHAALPGFSPRTVRRFRAVGSCGKAALLHAAEKIDDYRAAYEILAASEEFPMPSFEEYYIREKQGEKGGGRVYLLAGEGGFAATVSVMAKAAGEALIGAVAVHPDRRRRGYGGAAVGALCDSLLREGVSPFVTARNEGAFALYRSLGMREEKAGLLWDFTKQTEKKDV